MIQFRPAKRIPAPLVIGLAGPSKSGKSLSGLRMATGLANGGTILMVNTEPHGHHYADRFTYQAFDMAPPHRPDKYTEVLAAAQALNPAVLIIDSLTHMHDGIGGMNEWHDEIALEMAQGDRKRAEKMNAPAWAVVKASENHFVYQLLSMGCHVILTFRAKEKVKIARDGKWHDLGWRPIMSDRIAFETMFTLMFLPYSGGVPDLDVSELRWPFDGDFIPKDKPVDEALGRSLAEWAKGNGGAPSAGADGESILKHAVVTENSVRPLAPVRPPAMTPLDEWKDLWRMCASKADYDELNRQMTHPQTWGTFKGPDQKELLAARDAAKKRIA